MLTNFRGTLAVREGDRELAVGPLVSDDAQLETSGGHLSSVTFSVWLDAEIIEKLEGFRKEGKGHLYFGSPGDIQATGWLGSSQERHRGPNRFTLETGIPKRFVRDDWLEALKLVGYRKWRVYEAPESEVPEEWQITPHLDQAWTAFHQSNPGVAMQECQKALEGLKEALSATGYVENKEIDFGKLTSAKRLGESLEKVWSGAWGFNQPGRHRGTTITNRDGEFAVLVTHALANYVAKLVTSPEA